MYHEHVQLSQGIFQDKLKTEVTLAQFYFNSSLWQNLYFSELFRSLKTEGSDCMNKFTRR